MTTYEKFSYYFNNHTASKFIVYLYAGRGHLVLHVTWWNDTQFCDRRRKSNISDAVTQRDIQADMINFSGLGICKLSGTNICTFQSFGLTNWLLIPHILCKGWHLSHIYHTVSNVHNSNYVFPKNMVYNYQCQLELSLIGICIIPIPALSQKIRIHGYNIIIISKKGGNFGTLWLGIKIVCLAHLHIICIVCSKFHLYDLKIVGEVFD